MEKTIDVIVDGGAASAGPPLGPALGPMGINAGAVVAQINEETKDFKGMKVPVKVIVETTTKEFKIEVGAPPTAELIKKEAGIEKGAGNREAPAGDVKLESLVKIAKSKSNSLGKSLKDTLKEVVGSCVSIGINIDGKTPKTVLREIESGAHETLLKGS
jgi:large subunit ribosomal protein L11